MDLNLEPVPENPVRQKQIAVALAAIAVVALVFSCVSRRWMARDEEIGDAGYGPRGWSCESGCSELDGSHSNAAMIEIVQSWYDRAGLSGGPSKVFPIAGWLTIGLSLIAVIGLIVSAVQALGAGVRTRPIAPTSIALLALMLALVAGCVFFALNPLRERGMSPVGVSWPFFVFGVGVVIGITAAQKLIKFKRLEPGELALY